VHVLAVASRGGVLAGREHVVEQRGVGQQARVEVELERLGVIGEVVIGRVRRAAAGVADAGADDGGVTPEPGVGGPESTQAEGRGLDDGRLLQVEGEHRVKHTRG
jgi:hypothetical protein